MTDTIITRAATFEPTTFNPTARTVDVIFSTGAEVRRHDYEGPFGERLSMAPEAVDLTDFIGGPVLNSHNRYDVNSVLGTVEAASVDGKRGVATVRFGFGDAAETLAKNVQAGIVRSVSIGYTVAEHKVEKDSAGVRTKTATRWKPVELSFVAVPADSAAKVRSKDMELHQQIRTMTDLMGLPATFADGLIERNATIEEARAAAVTELQQRNPPIVNRAPATVTRDASDQLVTRMADGLLSRIQPGHTPDAGREFAYSGIVDIARRCLQERGLSTLGSRADIITRAAHTTSDFPNVFAEVFNKSLATIRTSPPAIATVYKRSTVDDFRKKHIYEISDGGGLDKVNEKGEIKSGTITDKELASYKIDSYGKIYSLSFQALISDDLGALSDMTSKATRGARSFFAGFLVDTLIAYPKLADNVALFHASHGNLAGSGAVPSENTIQAAKLAMRLQKDLSGNPVDAAPRYILHSATLESTVDKLLATLYPTQPADAIVSARNLTPIVEPRLDAKSATAPWYLFADPAVAPVLEYCELSGSEGPQVETRQGWDTLGIDLRVIWHLGAGAIDSRGAFKNPGA